jgi:hypothetical protein
MILLRMAMVCVASISLSLPKNQRTERNQVDVIIA